MIEFPDVGPRPTHPEIYPTRCSSVSIQVEQLQVTPDITVVQITGRLYLSNQLVSTEFFLRRLIQQGTRKLVLDLAGVDRIDSAGIGTLMMCSGEILDGGGQLRLAGLQASVAESLRIVRVDQLVPIDPDLESACKALGAS